MLVLHNEKSNELAEDVAKKIGAQVGKVERIFFPDGEIYVRLMSSVKDEEVILIHTTQNNDDLIELILMLSAISDNGAKKIRCVIPHMVYQRQDTAFKEGEAISAKVFLKIIKSFADEIITVNAHFLEKAGKEKFEGIPITNLDAFPLLGKHFSGVENLVIVSPDEGSMHYAEAAGKAIGCEYDHLVKKRIDGETVEIQPKDIDVNGKNVVILDDIISTGGTMKKAADTLLSKGARKVSLGCVHGIFTKGTDIFGDLNVICTDSLPTQLSKVSLAPILVDLLK